MTMQQALIEAMHLPEDSDTVQRIHEFGLAVADEDTMSQAIHDVYCGIMADHSHPNEKDRDQARQMIAALQKHAAAGAGA
ncbi:MAG: hypothetical protein ACJ765_12860 [Chloroflexota bacterium]